MAIYSLTYLISRTAFIILLRFFFPPNQKPSKDQEKSLLNSANSINYFRFFSPIQKPNYQPFQITKNLQALTLITIKKVFIIIKMHPSLNQMTLKLSNFISFITELNSNQNNTINFVYQKSLGKASLFNSINSADKTVNSNILNDLIKMAIFQESIQIINPFDDEQALLAYVIHFIIIMMAQEFNIIDEINLGH